MQLQVTLTINDEQGRTQTVALNSSRLTIGRSQDNDLAIDGAGISRRHALIENYEGIIQISDSGSQNGTFVNGSPVTRAMVLADGDVISIGDCCDITVSIKATRNAAQAGGLGKGVATDRSAEGTAAGARSTQASSATTWLSPPVIAAAAIVIILFAAAMVFVLSRGDSTNGNARARNRDNGGVAAANDNSQLVSQSNSNSEPGINAGGICGEATSEQIGRGAVQVIGRITSGGQSYEFSPKVVGDIQKKIEQHCRSDELAAALRSIAQRKTEIAAEVRRSGQGIESYFATYAALAEMDGGRRSSDSFATVRRMLADLVAVRIHFGTDADSSLLTVAAYTMGPGTKKSHPLLPTIRRLVQSNPAAKRNVWYLHERGGLDDSAYDFVVKFLAFGIISQNPRVFGVQAEPLVF